MNSRMSRTSNSVASEASRQPATATGNRGSCVGGRLKQHVQSAPTSMAGTVPPFLAPMADVTPIGGRYHKVKQTQAGRPPLPSHPVQGPKTWSSNQLLARSLEIELK